VDPLAVLAYRAEQAPPLIGTQNWLDDSVTSVDWSSIKT